MLGLLLETVGFLGGHTNEMPFVIAALSPAYTTSVEAAKTKLDKGEPLTVRDRGFEHIANMFLDLLRKDNPPERMNGVSVQSIRMDGSGMIRAMGKVLAKDTYLKIKLSNGQELGWEMSAIDGRMAELIKTRIVLISVITFLAGVLLQVIVFILERKEKAEQAIPADRGEERNSR